jgi:hypothetical protein
MLPPVVTAKCFDSFYLLFGFLGLGEDENIAPVTHATRGRCY